VVDVMRLVMRTVGALHLRVYRASGGRLLGRTSGMPVLLLTVAGRKTGAPHTTPLVYLDSGGRYVVTGSAGGSSVEPQWFRNLRKADRAVVEVGRQRTPVTVEIAPPQERQLLWEQLVRQSPGFGRYQAKAHRVIPMAILTPDRGGSAPPA
jgi:deazaflavin-dependent oxidoreductase (nitroreductase family)